MVINMIKYKFFKTILLSITVLLASCSSEENCEYSEAIAGNLVFDCETLQLNIGDKCDYNNDGVNNGTIDVDCDCIADYPIISDCPGFMQNGDFEIVVGDPNVLIEQDINLATNWVELWERGSLADLYDVNTTTFRERCFISPIPPSGAYAGMWVQNPNRLVDVVSFRQGMLNQLVRPINQDTGSYLFSFNYANMGIRCSATITNDVKIGVYGVYRNPSDPLPANPTGISTPSNLDLFGASNTVFLGEVNVAFTATNDWESVLITIDTNALVIPANGINHIMITNSHLSVDSQGLMYLGFDDFCLIN